MTNCFIHVHGTCNKTHERRLHCGTRERERERELVIELVRERERERERERKRDWGRERVGHANTYQFGITSESPCLVHTWYL